MSAVGGLEALVLLALSALHVYWAAGGCAGASAAVPARPDVGGGPLFRPRPLGTLVLSRALLWLAGGAFGLRAVGEFRYVGAFKRVRGTRFAVLDTWVYTPLCAALSAATLWLVWVPGDARAGLSADRDHQLFACAIANSSTSPNFVLVHGRRRPVGARISIRDPGDRTPGRDPP